MKYFFTVKHFISVSTIRAQLNTMSTITKSFKSFRIVRQRRGSFLEPGLELESKSFIVGGEHVFTRFKCGGTRWATLHHYEFQLGLNTDNLIHLTTGVRKYDSWLMGSLTDGKTTYEEVIAAWNKGENLINLIRK